MKYLDIIKIVRPVIEAEGYVYWGIEFNTYGRRALLRVFIDHPEGISLDDCSAVSHQLSGVLDVANFSNQPYTLEVSSPGIERPLFDPEQYGHYIGSKIQVRCFSPVSGRKRITGFLEAINDKVIKVKMDDEYINIPMEKIRKANIVVDKMDQYFK